MKTRPEIEVFDDAEYCNSKKNSLGCDFLNSDWCNLYVCELDTKYSNNIELASKCDQCKADYAKAEKEVKEVWLGKWAGTDIFARADNAEHLKEFSEYVSKLHKTEHRSTNLNYREP